MVRGSCLCGGVRFQVNGPVAELQNCHCSQCRKAYGSAFGTVAIVDARHFAYLEGTPLIASSKQSERVTRYFCSKCGSPLPIEEAWDPLVGIPAGVLDDDPRKRPSAHIFVASKAPWWEITDGAPQYREWPPGQNMNERFSEIGGKT
jgi:hypothetical protein